MPIYLACFLALYCRDKAERESLFWQRFKCVIHIAAVNRFA